MACEDQGSRQHHFILVFGTFLLRELNMYPRLPLSGEGHSKSTGVDWTEGIWVVSENRG